MGKIDSFHSYLRKVRNIQYELWISRAFRAVAEQTGDGYIRYLERRPLTKKFPDFHVWAQAWMAVERICRRKALEYRDGIRI